MPAQTVRDLLSQVRQLVSGDLRIDAIDMQPGDLQFAHPGCEHGPLSTVNGALVFVRGILKTVPELRVS